MKKVLRYLFYHHTLQVSSLPPIQTLVFTLTLHCHTQKEQVMEDKGVRERAKDDNILTMASIETSV